MLFAILTVLALCLTAISLWKRSIVLSMGAATSWTVLGLLFLTNPGILGSHTLSDGWMQLLGMLLVLMAVGCLLWYISGIGKTHITMTNSRGQSWTMWSKPPTGPVKSRSVQVRESHRARLQGIVDRHTSRRR